MPVLRRDGPYIWVTWLNKLVTGDQSCEWAYWFRTQFDSSSWTRAERVGNLARWQVGHTVKGGGILELFHRPVVFRAGISRRSSLSLGPCPHGRCGR